MRVLLLNQVFHPDPQATSQYLSRLAIELVRQGHEVTVLTGRRDYADPTRQYPARETWNGVEIIRVWSTGSGHASKRARILNFLSFFVLASLRGLFVKRPDVIVALTTPPLVSVLGAILSRLRGARFIYWVMDLNPDEVIAVGWLKTDSLLARFLEATSRWSLRQASRVIVLDIYMRDRIQSKGIAPEKIEVIPPWSQGEVNFDPAGRARFRREYGLENKYVIMYAGNHTPCHPLETLVETARFLRDEPRVHFCFVGGGTEWGHLRERARVELHWDNVTFLGYQSETDLPGLLSAADRQVVVMGEPFVGIVHPCKVYNFLAAQRPFIYIGPKQSHITDLIQEAGLEAVAISFRHGENFGLGEEIRKRARADADGEMTPAWPAPDRFAPWSEEVILKKLISTLVA